jgi:Tfp pilus assembly protein PilF
MFMRMGNDDFQSGNYANAATRLQRAINNGADPVIANQRLAQSYSSLGKKSEAAEAYKRAIAACSDSLNSGHGDAAKLRAVRDACETALKQIQGG